MDNSIKFKYPLKNGKKYELYFTKRTVKQMEENGFTVGKSDDMENVPMSVFMDLYDGSFLAKHADVDKETRDNILDTIFKNSQGKLLQALYGLYQLTYVTLLVQEEENEGETPQWTAPSIEEMAKNLKKK